MEDYKPILGAIAVVMTVWAHIPYLFHTIKGTNKPHIFTWVIWTLLTGIGFAGQFSANAGAGAWATGVCSIVCLIITVAALKGGSKDITLSDWVMFVCGLLAIPVWLLTDDPLWSILIITLIDACAFFPTIRKSWHRPLEENTFMYGFNIPRHAISLLAISNVSVTTALYTFALLIMNALMYLMLKMRRAYLSKGLAGQ